MKSLLYTLAVFAFLSLSSFCIGIGTFNDEHPMVRRDVGVFYAGWLIASGITLSTCLVLIVWINVLENKQK